MPLFLDYLIVDGSTENTGIKADMRVDDNYKEFLKVASQKLAGGDSVIRW
jgi:hypothetical protein